MAKLGVRHVNVSIFLAMYLYRHRLVIDFYKKESALAAAQFENEAIVQGNVVSVTPMQPWHAMTLGDFVERVGPDFIHGNLLVDGEATVAETSTEVLPYGRALKKEPEDGNLDTEQNLKNKESHAMPIDDLM